jgi:hypothetical protein
MNMLGLFVFSSVIGIVVGGVMLLVSILEHGHRLKILEEENEAEKCDRTRKRKLFFPPEVG